MRQVTANLYPVLHTARASITASAIRPLRWRPSPTRGSVPLTVPGVLAALALDMAQKKASITTLALCGFSACERMSRIPGMALSRIASVPRIPCPLPAPLAQPQRSTLLK